MAPFGDTSAARRRRPRRKRRWPRRPTTGRRRQRWAPTMAHIASVSGTPGSAAGRNPESVSEWLRTPWPGRRARVESGKGGRRKRGRAGPRREPNRQAQQRKGGWRSAGEGSRAAAAASAAGAVARAGRGESRRAVAAAHAGRVRGLFRLLRRGSPGRRSGRPRRPFGLCAAPEALLRGDRLLQKSIPAP